jgi:hypothetical protein
MRRIFATFVAAIAGATSVSMLHELGGRIQRRPSRPDGLREQALAIGLGRLGVRRPSSRKLHRMARLGSMITDSMFYGALLARQPAAWQTALEGSVAALVTLTLPRALDIRRHSDTKWPIPPLTVACYAVGGLSAYALYAALAHRPARSATQALPISRAAL